MPSGGDRRALPAFLLFTLLLSSIFYFLIAKSGHTGGGGGGYITALMWSPGLAALLTCKFLGRDVSTLGWKWGETRYHVICYLIPLGYSTVTYAFVWLTGLGGFPNPQLVDALTRSFGLGPIAPWASIALYFFFNGSVNVIRDCATVLGEEIGWRGFLVPELAKRNGFAATAIGSGLIWAVWHYPLLLLADYHSSTPVWYFLTVFTVGVPLLNFVWTWMRLKTGSLWPGVILHASHNTFIQGFYDPMTVDNAKTRYVAGEFGIGIFLFALALAIYFWSRRREVLPVPEVAQ